jgi:hypothetical protein
MTMIVLFLFTSKLFSQSSDSISFSKQNIAVEHHQTKSSTQAVLFSLALPGLGQVYTETYWKVPVIVGFCSYFGYQWFQANDYYLRYRNQYKATTNPQSRRVRDFYRTERDKFAWYFCVTYILNGVDAYVNAQLYDFDIGTSLTANENSSAHLIRLNYYFRR